MKEKIINGVLALLVIFVGKEKLKEIVSKYLGMADDLFAKLQAKDAEIRKVIADKEAAVRKVVADKEAAVRKLVAEKNEVLNTKLEEVKVPEAVVVSEVPAALDTRTLPH